MINLNFIVSSVACIDVSKRNEMKDSVSVTNFPTGENFNQAHFMLGENTVLGRIPILRGMFENEKSI